MVRIRVLDESEVSLLPRFLALASHEEEVESVVANPALAIYVAAWGREGDCGVVAEDQTTGSIVGMAWARFWTAENHGFGWVDEWTPELAIAVEPQFRDLGLGTRLIEAIMGQLHSVSLSDSRGVSFLPERLTLSVRADSPAVQLYERLGFEKIDGSESVNRTGGVSFNMVASLCYPPKPFLSTFPE